MNEGFERADAINESRGIYTEVNEHKWVLGVENKFSIAREEGVRRVYRPVSEPGPNNDSIKRND